MLIDESEEPIAKAYDMYLYPSDMSNLSFDGLSTEDSAALAERFINDWVKHQVIVNKAESEEKVDIDAINRKVEEIKYQLIRHDFEKSLVGLNLDTLITKEEIEKYYEEHQADFELKQNIVKCMLVKLHKDTPKISTFKKAFYKKQYDNKYIQEYCDEYADAALLNDSSWVYMDKVIYGSPYAKVQDQKDFLKNTTVSYKKDKDYYYYIKLIDYRLVGGNSPLEFHISDIANIIYNQRRIELVKSVEEKMYKDALNEQEIEIYNK